MKRVIYTLFAICVLVAAAVPLMAEEADIEISVKCNDKACILPKETLMELIEAHNAHVEEIKSLRAKCKPVFKKERDL